MTEPFAPDRLHLLRPADFPAAGGDRPNLAAGGGIALQRLLGRPLAPVVWPAGAPVRSGRRRRVDGNQDGPQRIRGLPGAGESAAGNLFPGSRNILIYALCGFANPGRLGIMIGGMGAMAPERREEIVALGFRSILAETLATPTTGAAAGILLA
ncbi:MAG: nucleoside transporter C-terminal domain-containing protein [Desulfococcaceae bacterium]